MCCVDVCDLVFGYFVYVVVDSFDIFGLLNVLFIEQVGFVMGVYFVCCYGNVCMCEFEYKGVLFFVKVVFVKELLMEKVDFGVLIEEVVNECDLLCGYFICVFLCIIGCMLYQWLFEQCVMCVCELIEIFDMMLVDIVVVCGFVDQSYLNCLFVWIVGYLFGVWWCVWLC